MWVCGVKTALELPSSWTLYPLLLVVDTDNICPIFF